MKRLKKEWLNALPPWAKKRVRQQPPELFDNFRSAVRVMHSDGSIQLFLNAWSIYCGDEKGEFLVVVTEHNGYYVITLGPNVDVMERQNPEEINKWILETNTTRSPG